MIRVYRMQGDVVDRLNVEAARVREKKKALQDASLLDATKDLTFTPTLSAKSSKASRSFLWWNDENQMSATNTPNTTSKLARTFSIQSNVPTAASTPGPERPARRSNSASRVPSGPTGAAGNQRNPTPTRDSGCRSDSAARGRTVMRDSASGIGPSTTTRRQPQPAVVTPSSQVKRSSSTSRIGDRQSADARSNNGRQSSASGGAPNGNDRSLSRASSTNNVANRPAAAKKGAVVQTAPAVSRAGLKNESDSTTREPAHELEGPYSARSVKSAKDTPWDSTSPQRASHVTTDPTAAEIVGTDNDDENGEKIGGPQELSADGVDDGSDDEEFHMTADHRKYDQSLEGLSRRTLENDPEAESEVLL
jgi:hypothetical protein